MTSPFTRNGWIRIAIITAVGLAILPFSPGFRQRQNLRLATAHADKLRPILQADSRFKSIAVGAHTGSGGSLMLHGPVYREEDKVALAKIVADSKSPVPIILKIWEEQPHGEQDETDESSAPIHADRD